jgi:hypothetical protein
MPAKKSKQRKKPVANTRAAASRSKKAINKKIVVGGRKNRSTFSRKQLALFAAAFAVIGGIVLYRAFAATQAYVVEAETMALSSQTVITDSNASGGKAVSFLTNGSATASVTFDGPVSSLSIKARGAQCQGAPKIELRIDTALVTTFSVSSTSYSSYSYTLPTPITSGVHTLSVSYPNDYTYTRKNNRVVCNRNVYLDNTTFNVEQPVVAPEPTPTPTEPVPTQPTPTYNSYQGYGPGNWPGASWRPFAETAAWNKPVPTSPQLLTNSSGYTSAQMVAWLTGRGMPDKITVNTSGSWDYSHPYYFAKDTDPIVTLKDTVYVGANNNVTKIRMPLNVQARSAAAAGGDGHISIVQPDGSVCGAWQYTGTTNGLASASAWGCSNVATGNGNDNFTTTAAWFNNMAGMIRAQEIEAGNIDHALFAITNCTWSNAVAPARAGTTARKCTADQPALPLGARIQLDPSYVLPSGLPAWKYPILRALQKYGAIVGDTGAYSRSISFGLMMESGQHYVTNGEVDQVGAFAEKSRAQGDIAKGTNGTSTYWAMDFGRGVDWTKLRVVAPY